MFRRRPFRFRRQGKMSSRSKVFTGTVAIAALLSFCSPVFAQSDDDPEMRIERLENQLRQLTGQNEELQYRNRQLEERLRALEGGAPAAPGQAQVQPNAAAVPPAQILPSQGAPGYRQQQQAVQPNYEQPQNAAPAPIVQEQPAPGAPGQRRRGDAFDPSQNPSAPGAPRALGGGQQPREPARPAGATPASRSILPTPARAISKACRRQRSPAIRLPNRGRPAARVSPPCRRRQRRATSSTSASATCSARTMRWPSRP
jgi:hypothetical protein